MGSLAAIEAIARRAKTAGVGAEARWANAAPGAGSLGHWADLFKNAGRLTLNFHPDRVDRSATTAAAGFAADGVYRSQWITGVSAGSRSALPGGERQRFEREFFDGAYETTDVSSGIHPVYGALDLVFDHHGGAPRFGSCFVVLRSHVRDRATLCLGDSHAAPQEVGTFADPVSVLCGLAEQAARGALLNRPLASEDLWQALEGRYRSEKPARDLDGYVEIQVHGGVSLADDVEAVILDPSFRGSDIERHITIAAKRCGFEIGWHPGSEITVEDVPVNFRGPTMRELAARVAGPREIVDAAAIGARAAQVPFEEPIVQGDPDDAPLQQLKYLWHTLLAHGSDAKAGP